MQIISLTYFVLFIVTARLSAVDRIGRYAFFAYVGLLLVLYIGDRFSTPPTSVAELVWPGIIAEGILIAWAWWFDRHRVLRSLN